MNLFRITGMRQIDEHHYSVRWDKHWRRRIFRLLPPYGITIPNSVTSVSYMAFSGYSGLTIITIPSSVTSIGNYAFSYCSSLTSIMFSGTKARWNAISKGSSWNNNTGSYTIHCTDGDISK